MSAVGRPERALLDTNTVVFFLTGRPAAPARAAARLFERAERGELELIVPLTTIAEAIWVLTSPGRGIPRAAVARALADLVSADGVRADESPVALEALRIYGERRVDFVDAYLAARASRDGTPVASFDRDFDRLGVERLEPV